MASAKKKNVATHPVRKTGKPRGSSKFFSENDDLRLGMDRRKFSYTVHVPERRSSQNRIKSSKTFKDAKPIKSDPC